MDPNDLKRFVLRVRALRAWQRLGWALAGWGVLALGWTVLDLFAVSYVSWTHLGIWGGTLAVLALLSGWLWPVPVQSLAMSIDRRAGLKDRLATALETGREETLFDGLQREDARSFLGTLKPKEVFPWLMTRWHWGGMAASCLAGGLFWTVSSDILLSVQQKEARKTAELAAKAIERVAKPIEESADKKPGKGGEEKRELARDMQRLAEDLRRSRVSQEKLLQKADQIAAKARKLALKEVKAVEQAAPKLAAQAAEEMLSQKGQMSLAEMKKAALNAEQQAALDQLMTSLPAEEGLEGQMGQGAMKEADLQMTAEDLKNLGLEDLDSRLMNMSDQQAKQLMKELESKIKSLESKGEGASEQDKKLLELLKELREKLKLSEAARKALRELANSKEYKELARLMAELRKKAEEAQEKGERAPLTDEELDRLREAAEGFQRKMEEFTKDWNDPKKREEMLARIREMIEALKSGELKMGACRTCMGLLPGMGVLPGMPGGMAPGTDEVFMDTDQINTLDKPEDIKATTQASKVRSSRNPKGEGEVTMEFKAPTFVGTRSSVSRSSLVPKYKREAEKAISGKAVPKEHQERVKRYFDSLTGGRK